MFEHSLVARDKCIWLLCDIAFAGAWVAETISQHDFYVEVGIETIEKRIETRGKDSENFISVIRMDLKKAQKQGTDERTQGDSYTSSTVNFFQMYRVLFLHSLISALFLYFSHPSLYLKCSCVETSFSIVHIKHKDINNSNHLMRVLARMLFTNMQWTGTKCAYRVHNLLSDVTGRLNQGFNRG